MRDVRITGGGRGLRGGPGKRADGVFAGRLQPRTRGNVLWRRTAGKGAERFMAKWIATEKVRARLRHAVICPNVMGRTKERIVQSKRARAGSLAIVD